MVYMYIMKREIDSIRVDRDMVHARRVNHTDFRGIGHPSLKTMQAMSDTEMTFSVVKWARNQTP